MKAEKTPPTETSSPPDSDLQGEGNGEARRPHRDAVEKLVESHDAESLARDA